MSVDAMTADKLIASGLPLAEAVALAEGINAQAGRPVQAAWSTISRQFLRPNFPPAVHLCVHRYLFRDWSRELGPAPAWFPSPESAKATNLGRLLSQLDRASYSSLYEWSITHRAEFWDTMIRRLGIRFQTPYRQVLDPQSSPRHPQWMVGAQINIADSCFQANPAAVAIRFSRPDHTLAEWTYSQLEAVAETITGGLQRMGLVPGDRVAIDLPMTAESVAIYLGIVRAGCVVVSIADSFSPAEIAIRLRIGRAKAIFTQDYLHRAGKRIPLYERVCQADPPRAVVLPGESLEPVRLREQDLSWQEFLREAPRAKSVARSPAEHTNYLFSSGTTGEPKAIPWSHTSPIKCAVDGLVHQDIQPGDVVAWPTNLGWMMGPWLIYASLINKATIALFHDAASLQTFGKFVQNARVTMLGVIPSLVATWRRDGCLAGSDWSAIKCFSSTGECASADDMLWLMAQAGYRPVIEYCGGTELAGGYAAGTLVQPQAPATFSTPTLGTELAILDEQGQRTSNGELFLVPPAIGMSVEIIDRDHDEVYYRDAPRDRDGQMLRRHGDQIECLPGGYFIAHGRVDDTMNLGGIKVSSAEIERVLSELPGVRETAAIAVSPPRGGPSRLVIFTVPEPDRLSVTSTELMSLFQHALNRDLNPLFRIHDVVVVNTLPRTATNKVMRRELRSQYVKAETSNLV